MADKKPEHKSSKKTPGFLGMFKKDVDGIQKGGYTRLQNAVKYGKAEQVRKWLNMGAEPDFAGARGPEERPLAIAIRQCKIKTAKTLLKNGADPNHHVAGQSYLSLAVRSRYPSLVDLLLKHKADPKILDLWTNETPLFHVHDHDKYMIETIIKYGCPVNAVNHEGQTALYNAVVNRKLGAAKVLLSFHADPNIKPEDAPDLLALVMDNVTSAKDPLWGIVRPLISAGANPNVVNKNKQSLMMLATLYGDAEMAEYAKKRCQNLNATDNRGNTPLHIALMNKDLKLIHSVLDTYTACPAGKNADGHSAVTLLMADPFYMDHSMPVVKDVIKRILDMGGNIDAQGADGRTLLNWAVYYQDVEFLETILAYKPATELRDTDGFTALSLAVDLGNLEIADILLDHGADPNVANSKGWTILDLLSSQKGDRTSPMVQRLMAAGGQYAKQIPANDHAPVPQGKATPIKKPSDGKGRSVKPPKPY